MDLPREPNLPSDEVVDKFCESNKFAGNGVTDKQIDKQRDGLIMDLSISIYLLYDVINS